MSDLLLVSHGSRDPQAQVVTRRLAGAVSAALGPAVRVGVGYLELAEPSVTEALDALRAPVVVQPLLFAPAFHATDDLPKQLAGRDGVVVAPVLAPDPLLLDALDRRLGEALAVAGDGAAGAPDGLVLVSAGTSYPSARALLDEVAASWGERHGVPGVAAYASTEPGACAQIRALRAQGCARIAVGALFIAPGRLLIAAREEALGDGAVAVADPLADAPELVELLVQRYRARAHLV